jgi:protein transport protein SEC61 subunit alpha
MPIILQSALVSNVYFFSQILYQKFSSNFFVKMLGRWQEVEGAGYSIPTGGMAYYLSPPRDFFDLARDPLHSIVYIAFILFSCAWFSKTWIDLSGSSSRDVAKQLRDQDMTISGFRENMIHKELNR